MGNARCSAQVLRSASLTSDKGRITTWRPSSLTNLGGMALSLPPKNMFNNKVCKTWRNSNPLLKCLITLRSRNNNLKVLTSCPSCLQGLSRYGDDLDNGLLEPDYIVVEMARHILGDNWMPDYVQAANQGGIERVLV